MAVRRGPLRRTEREELVAYIHGIDPEGELAHILVHQRGNSVRFSGRLGAHNVSPSNSSGLEKWVEEAKIVWELDETIGISRNWMNTPETLEKIEMMRVKAMQKKENLEAIRELHAQ
jgi:hypothetical protein